MAAQMQLLVRVTKGQSQPTNLNLNSLLSESDRGELQVKICWAGTLRAKPIYNLLETQRCFGLTHEMRKEGREEKGKEKKRKEKREKEKKKGEKKQGEENGLTQ